MNANLNFEGQNLKLVKLIKDICADRFFKAYRLVGGTSLAFRLGHRLSTDADFFSDGHGKPVEEITWYLAKYDFIEIKRDHGGVLGFVRKEEYTDVEDGTNTFKKLDVFDYGDPFVYPAETIDGIRLASVLDIGLMKLNAQTRRNSWKDLVDLAIITRQHDFPELKKMYRSRYPRFDIKDAINSLQFNIENIEGRRIEDIVIYAKETKEQFVNELNERLREFIRKEVIKTNKKDENKETDFGIGM